MDTARTICVINNYSCRDLLITHKEISKGGNMGILSGIMGNASEVNPEKLEKELIPLMVEGETIDKVFKLIRDLVVFTNKRIILINKQGITGKKSEYLSIPYKSIKYFSKEGAGHLDLDAEIKIWLSGEDTPREFEFKRGNGVDEVHQIISKYTLLS